MLPSLDRFDGFPYAQPERERPETALEKWARGGWDPADEMPEQQKEESD